MTATIITGICCLFIGFTLGLRAMEWVYNKRLWKGKLIYKRGETWIGQPSAFLDVCKRR